MLGSLRKIWPWKSGGFEKTEIPVNVWPPLMVNGSFNLEIVFSILLLLFGMMLVVWLEKSGSPKP